MKLFRGLALGIAASLAFSAMPAYASAELITLLPYAMENNAEEDESSGITLEQAFVLAARNNSSIDALHDSIVFIQQQRRSLAQDHDNAWRFGAGLTDLSAEMAMRGMRNIDASVVNAAAQARMIEVASHYLVLSNFDLIHALEMDLAILRERAMLQVVTLNHTELRNSLGLASNADLVSARQDLQSVRAQQRVLEVGLNAQYDALRHLLGLPRGRDLRINHEANLDRRNISMIVRNIEHYADRKILGDPSIVILRRQLDVAQANYGRVQPWLQNTVAPQMAGQPINTQANTTDRASMINALNNASRELRDATDDMRENIRQTYSQLRQLEEQRETLVIDLRRARDDYENAVVGLEAGTFTQHEVDAVRLAILVAEGNLVVNALNYENLMFAFEFPFLLAR